MILDHNPFRSRSLARPQRIVAHLALEAARIASGPTRYHTLFQNLHQYRIMKCFPAPRGELTRSPRFSCVSRGPRGERKVYPVATGAMAQAEFSLIVNTVKTKLTMITAAIHTVFFIVFYLLGLPAPWDNCMSNGVNSLISWTVSRFGNNLPQVITPQEVLILLHQYHALGGGEIPSSQPIEVHTAD